MGCSRTGLCEENLETDAAIIQVRDVGVFILGSSCGGGFFVFPTQPKHKIFQGSSLRSTPSSWSLDCIPSHPLKNFTLAIVLLLSPALDTFSFPATSLLPASEQCGNISCFKLVRNSLDPMAQFLCSSYGKTAPNSHLYIFSFTDSYPQSTGTFPQNCTKVALFSDVHNTKADDKFFVLIVFDLSAAFNTAALSKLLEYLLLVAFGL